MDNIKELILLDIKELDLSGKVDYINNLREFIHSVSPFKSEPVDLVRWEIGDNVIANDYNPNKVAPPEMELLEVSIINDGYTQPIVTWKTDGNEKVEVIDGFHRKRVGSESKIVKGRIYGYLPVVNIRKSQANKSDRIASTIRHNRARGKHQVDAMSEIVIELKNRNWTNVRISKQLGMDEEEVLRLCQVSGLEHLFSDNDFTKAWESSDTVNEYEKITDVTTDEELSMFRIPNEGDIQRIFHTYDKWECYKAGFYKSKKEGWTNEQSKLEFVRILTNTELFSNILEKLIHEWKYSCEHYLTNKSMNRIAWLGQAAVCYESGVPSVYSSAWFNMTDEQQVAANNVALKYLNIWLSENDMELLDIDTASIKGRQVELY